MGWELPADMTEREWRAAGELLGKVERSVSWWLGDWWAFSVTRYGERKAIVQDEDWDGPELQTCKNAAAVCRTFETSRRRDVLSFKHHAEVASLVPAEADTLLDWAEEPIAQTGKPRPTRDLRAEVGKRRNAAAIGAPAPSVGTTRWRCSSSYRRSIKFGWTGSRRTWRTAPRRTRFGRSAALTWQSWRG